MNWSLRARLMLGIVTVTVLAFAAAAVVIFFVLRASLISEFDALLASKARALATLIKQNGDRFEIEFAEHPMQEFARKIRPEYYQVWDEDGSVIARSRRLGKYNLPRTSGSLAAPGYRFTELPDGRRGRSVAIDFLPTVEGESLQHERDDDAEGYDDIDGDQVDFKTRRRVALIVARDTGAIDQAIGRLALLLIGVFAAVITVTLGFVIWVVNRSVRPLDDLADQIDGLNEGDLAHRFQLSDSPSEIQPVVCRLNELLGRLEDAFGRERLLTANVAHELRTPIAGLRSTLGVTLSRNRDKEQYVQALRACEGMCEDMQRLVETLLSLARIEIGTTLPLRSAVEISALIAKSWEAYRGRANERALDVKIIGPRKTAIATDAAQLQVVVANLFDNAVDYTDAGGSIEVRWITDPHGFGLTVANSGCTLDDAQISKVFDRFWRADSARTSTGGHAGLGLALSQKIIEMLGGSIRAAAHDGMFVVTIRFGKEFLQRAVCEVSAACETTSGSPGACGATDGR